MKKEDFVKIGVSEDLAAKCETASLDELKGYIPRTRMNEVNEENKTLKQSVADRDKQLEDLKKLGGDNGELKKQLEALQQQNAEQKKTHEAELYRLKLDNAVEAALTAAGAKNNKAVRSLFDAEKLKLEADGKISGLDEQLAAVRKSDPYLFAEEAKPENTLKGFQPGAGADGLPGGKPDFSNMTYSQMAAYIQKNPNIKIE